MCDGGSSSFVSDRAQDGFLRYFERLHVSCLIVRSVYHFNRTRRPAPEHCRFAQRGVRKNHSCSAATRFLLTFSFNLREFRPAVDVAIDKSHATAFNGDPGIDWTRHAQGMD